MSSTGAQKESSAASRRVSQRTRAFLDERQGGRSWYLLNLLSNKTYIDKLIVLVIVLVENSVLVVM